MACKFWGVEMDKIDTAGAGPAEATSQQTSTASLLQLIFPKTHGEDIENEFQTANSVGDPGEACKERPDKTAAGICGDPAGCSGETQTGRCNGGSGNVCCLTPPQEALEEQDPDDQSNDNEADEGSAVGTDVTSLHGHSAEAQESAKAQLVKAGHAALQALLDSSKSEESGKD